MSHEPATVLDLIRILVSDLIPVTNEKDFGRVFLEKVSPHIDDAQIYPLIEELAMIDETLHRRIRYHCWIELAGVMLYRHGKQSSLDFLSQQAGIPFLKDLHRPLNRTIN